MRKLIVFLAGMGIASMLYADPAVIIKGGPTAPNIVRVDTSSRAVVNVEACAVSSVSASSTTAKIAVYPGQTFQVIDKKSSKAGTYAVNVASFSASTQLRPANTTRTGITITNYGAQIVFISTFTAADTTNMFPLAANNTAGDEFIDNVNPYTGIWYGLTIAGQAANNVIVFEKSE